MRFTKVIEDACKPLNEKDVEPTKSVLHEAGRDALGLGYVCTMTVDKTPLHLHLEP